MKSLLQALSEKLDQINELRAKKKQKGKKPASKAPQRVTPEKSEKVQKIELEISAATVVKVLLIVAVFYMIGELFVQLKSIVTVAVICFFLAIGLTPIVGAIEKRRIPLIFPRRIPRAFAILILYVLFIGALAILFVAVIPILAEQLFAIAKDLRDFFSNDENNIPLVNDLLEKLQFNPQEIQGFLAENLASISKNLQSVAGSTFLILSGVFQGVFNFIFALVLLFFMLLEREKLARSLLSLIPRKDRKYVEEKVITMQTKVSEWFKGQVILMVSVGLAMYVGMKMFQYVFGMQYAATLGLLAGFMELFPYIGVLITGILASLIAINISWVLFFAVIGWMIFVQFLEGNFLVPVVMEKVTGLSSVVVMLSLAIGGVLGHVVGGVALAILGMILAIPVAASIGVFVEEFAKKRY